MSKQARNIHIIFSEWASKQVKIRMKFANERASAKSNKSIVGQITAHNTQISNM